jgi:hypothetical protein
MAMPRRPPKTKVMIPIGSRLTGSFQKINVAEGKRTRKAINIPLTAAGIFRFVTEIKKPTTTHIEKAERLAS